MLNSRTETGGSMSKAKDCAKEISQWSKNTPNINPDLKQIFQQFERSRDSRSINLEVNNLLNDYLLSLNEKIEEHQNSAILTSRKSTPGKYRKKSLHWLTKHEQNLALHGLKLDNLRLWL